jgi:hypothetical protein
VVRVFVRVGGGREREDLAAEGPLIKPLRLRGLLDNSCSEVVTRWRLGFTDVLCAPEPSVEMNLVGLMKP